MGHNCNVLDRRTCVPSILLICCSPYKSFSPIWVIIVTYRIDIRVSPQLTCSLSAYFFNISTSFFYQYANSCIFSIQNISIMNILLLFFLTVLTLFMAAMYHIVVIVTPNVPCAASLTTLWWWGVGGWPCTCCLSLLFS